MNKKIDFKNIKHIIWDYNGTLLNDLGLCVEVINILLLKRDLKLISKIEYQDVFDFPVKDYYQKIGFDFIKESFEIIGTEFIDEYNKRQHNCKLHTGAIEILEQITNSGINQSILSARLQASLSIEIKNYGIDRFFKYVFGISDHYANGKLNRGKQLIEKINIPLDEILLIGDTTHDLEVANKLGIKSILIAHGHHSFEKLSPKSEFVINNFKELEKFICFQKS